MSCVLHDLLVFTNLTPEHIEAHGSFEKYREAALANETGLEEQMAFVPAHQKDIEKFNN